MKRADDQTEAAAAPACWSCAHYRRKVREDQAAFHWCEITYSGFPQVGKRCPGYLYDPVADAAEFGESG